MGGRTFTALARTDNWFKIILDGAERWVSAHFVIEAGPCLPYDADQPAASIEDMRAKEGKLSNLVFLIGDEPVSAVALTDCQVTARRNLNVRSNPAGQRTGRVAAGRTVTALARTDNWFLVALNGDERWISAHFVNMRGACQAPPLSQTGPAPAESLEDQRAGSDEHSVLGALLKGRGDYRATTRRLPRKDAPNCQRSHEARRRSYGANHRRHNLDGAGARRRMVLDPA